MDYFLLSDLVGALPEQQVLWIHISEQSSQECILISLFSIHYIFTSHSTRKVNEEGAEKLNASKLNAFHTSLSHCRATVGNAPATEKYCIFCDNSKHKSDFRSLTLERFS